MSSEVSRFTLSRLFRRDHSAKDSQLVKPRRRKDANATDSSAVSRTSSIISRAEFYTGRRRVSAWSNFSYAYRDRVRLPNSVSDTPSDDDSPHSLSPIRTTLGPSLRRPQNRRFCINNGVREGFVSWTQWECFELRCIGPQGELN